MVETNNVLKVSIWDIENVYKFKEIESEISSKHKENIDKIGKGSKICWLQK